MTAAMMATSGASRESADFEEVLLTGSNRLEARVWIRTVLGAQDCHMGGVVGEMAKHTGLVESEQAHLL
jgi:hypothetical protein